MSLEETGVLRRSEETDTHRGKKTTWGQRQSLEWCSYKPSDAQDCWQPPEARREAQKIFFPPGFRERAEPCWHLNFGTNTVRDLKWAPTTGSGALGEPQLVHFSESHSKWLILWELNDLAWCKCIDVEWMSCWSLYPGAKNHQQTSQSLPPTSLPLEVLCSQSTRSCSWQAVYGKFWPLFFSLLRCFSLLCQIVVSVRGRTNLTPH